MSTCSVGHRIRAKSLADACEAIGRAKVILEVRCRNCLDEVERGGQVIIARNGNVMEVRAIRKQTTEQAVTAFRLEKWEQT
jgi:hypothetical protein